ncbi:MAG TPA: DUF1565 domain-containing protein [bacterium]|nr:DUF1565 domain-containing protein [bacterium]
MRSQMRSLGNAAIVVASLAADSDAATRRVPQDYATITAALAAAAPGDVVQVAPGNYSPATGEVFPLTMATGNVSLLGSGMGITTLNAQGTNGCVVHNASIGGRIAGFTLTGGNAQNGGGILVTNGNVQIDHNLIVENGAQFRGAGIYALHNPAPAIQPWIHHNVVWDNFDSDPGDAVDPHGIVVADECAGVLEHNLVGRSDGNGLLTNGNTSVSVRHNIFIENGVLGPPPRGRGICWLGTQAARIYHNEFHANVVAAILWPAGGGNFSAIAANAVSAVDSVFGNIDGNPLLVNPDGLDFHLQAGSPAIDAGWPSLPLDPDGTVADLGPFFFPQSTGTPEIGEAVATMNVAPNPFQNATEISYVLQRSAHVLVEIIDVRGRRVSRLQEEDLLPGTHRVGWNGRNSQGDRVGAGMYFARIAIGGTIRTTNLVLLE